MHAQLVAGILMNDVVDKDLYKDYRQWLHEIRIIKFLREQKYPDISEELIRMGLPAGKPFGELAKNPLWQNYVSWYENFQRRLYCEKNGLPFCEDDSAGQQE